MKPVCRLELLVSAHIVAGWIWAIPTSTPPELGQSLPPELLTVSDCIGVDVPRPPDELGDWYQDRVEADTRALPGFSELGAHLLTVFMDSGDADEFMSHWNGQDSPFFDHLRRQQPPPSTAQILGFEVVGAEVPLDFHSWHCHGYADEVLTDLQIEVGELGLFNTLEEAHRVRDWMLALPAKQRPAEVPWTVVGVAHDGEN